jgi:multidrug efflux pump subunit AcrA (membrane-fusion protein)
MQNQNPTINFEPLPEAEQEAALQAELEAIRARRAAAQAAEKEEAERAKRIAAEAARREKEAAKRQVRQGYAQQVLDKLQEDHAEVLEAVQAYGYAPVIEGSSIRLRKPGQEAYKHVAGFSHYDIFSSSSWHARVTGQGIAVDANRYPSKKLKVRADGTINIASATAEVLQSLEGVLRGWKDSQAQASNAGALDALRKQFGLSKYSDLVKTTHTSYSRSSGYDTTTAPEGKLYMDIRALVTPEQAAALLQAMQDAGLRLS